MKHTLTMESTEDSLEEKKDIERALNAWKFASILFEFDQHLRSEIKYGEKNEYQPIRDKLWELINEEGIAHLLT